MAGQTKLMLPSGGSVSISASDSTQNTTVTLPGGDVTLATTSQVMGRNRIINGAMMIDQRNAGASVTPADGAYTLDRWVYLSDQASKCTIEQTISGVSAPAGFQDYLAVTSTAATTITTSQQFAVVQRIEGYNIADLDWGTANAKTVTLSFWVRSSLTGTFGGALRNDVGNYNYPFSYTISAANTWEYKTITVTGATSGAWVVNNGRGMQVAFSLGAGASQSGTAGAWSTSSYWNATGATQVLATNGATFYITGVQLEKATTATPFEFRPYGQELALCQRYLPSMTMGSSGDLCSGLALSGGTSALVTFPFLVTPRVAPSGVSVSGTLKCRLPSGSSTTSATLVQFDNANFSAGSLVLSGMSGLTAGNSAPGGTNTNVTVLFTGCEL